MVALVKTRKPRGKPLMRVEQERRTFRQSGRDLGDAADLESGIGACDAAQRAELVDLAMNSRRSSYTRARLVSPVVKR